MTTLLLHHAMGHDRRVANARIKGELGVALRYPTYRKGLRAIAAS